MNLVGSSSEEAEVEGPAVRGEESGFEEARGQAEQIPRDAIQNLILATRGTVSALLALNSSTIDSFAQLVANATLLPPHRDGRAPSHVVIQMPLRGEWARPPQEAQREREGPAAQGGAARRQEQALQTGGSGEGGQRQEERASERRRGGLLWRIGSGLLGAVVRPFVQGWQRGVREWVISSFMTYQCRGGCDGEEAWTRRARHGLRALHPLLLQHIQQGTQLVQSLQALERSLQPCPHSPAPPASTPPASAPGGEGAVEEYEGRRSGVAHTVCRQNHLQPCHDTRCFFRRRAVVQLLSVAANCVQRLQFLLSDIRVLSDS